jgi:outer membrane protein OmpA-like peptidoglycan-associated protein
MKSDQRGYYEFNIDRNSDYKLTGSHKKYIDSFNVFTSKNISKQVTKIRADLFLNPVKDVKILAELNKIYFDFDKYNIRPDAAIELNKVIKLLNDYPNMVLRIESHTDSRGSDSYNNRLSIDRANSVYDYFISQGVSDKKIVAHEGYGEQKLTNGCIDGVDCEEPKHQLNRRTEFIILQM